MKYKDLNLQIRRDPDGGYEVRAEFEGSGVGVDSASFELPDSFRNNHRSLTDAAATRSLAEADEHPAGEGVDPVAFGVELFDALFHDGTQRVLDKAQALADDSSEEGQFGLRLRLQFDMNKKGIAEVAGLPWELMRPSADDPPFAVSPQMSVVRYLEGTGGRPLQPLPRKLKIMLMVSDPEDVVALDGDKEAEGIKELDGVRGIEVRTFPATKEGLDEGLKKFKPHVFHYIGHGTQGALVLEDASGKRADFSGELLQAVTQGQKGLRLVFLNACDTAATDELSPWKGVAAAIFRAGVPGVVAMQFPIRDTAAKKFGVEFYRGIARGEGMEAALSAGRATLLKEELSDWSTPVMFLRDADEGEPPPPWWRLVLIWGERVLALVLGLMALVPLLMGSLDLGEILLRPSPRLVVLPLLAAVSLRGVVWLQRERKPLQLWGLLGLLAVFFAGSAWTINNTTVLRVVLHPDQLLFLADVSTDTLNTMNLTLPSGAVIPIRVHADSGTVVVGAGNLPSIAPVETWSHDVQNAVDQQRATVQNWNDYQFWVDTLGRGQILPELALVRFETTDAIAVLGVGDSLRAQVVGDEYVFTCVIGSPQQPNGKNVQDCFLFYGDSQ